ncbi:MAG TPA: restriction endonuclease subunit S [Veillonellaceae bacterium]|nr:restriction endonuclease subunit S [Veillonellaceae bacterium]
MAIEGDVFYQTVRPYQRNNYLYEETDRDYVFSTGYAQLRTSLDSYFLLTLLQNDNFVRIVLDNCTGTSYPAINSSALSKIPISTPKSIDETIKIGNTFRKLDNFITLHQRKLDHENELKEYLLRTMFPRGEKSNPRIRFPGFTGPWEKCKLGSVCAEIGDGLHSAPKFD